MQRKLTLEYWIDDEWYVGRITEAPGVFSQGATLAELEENILDAYKVVISDLEAGFDPPAPVQFKEIVFSL